MKAGLEKVETKGAIAMILKQRGLEPVKSCKKVLSLVKFKLVLSVIILLALIGIFDMAETAAAADKPETIAEIALYKGPDREKILVEGAKKEGEFVLYNSNSWITNVLSKEFEKKYPFLKVSAVRSQSRKLIKRVNEEYVAKRYVVDVMECSLGSMRILQRYNLFQEFYSPELASYPESALFKGKDGVVFAGEREMYYSLGFNTDAISPAEAPKNYEDLLDPKWKGRISMVASTTGVLFIGLVQEVMGQDYVEKLSGQNIKVQNITSAALNALIASGEVPLSPTAGSSTIILAKAKGAPVSWQPLEPVLTSLACAGMALNPPHPHAAILFLDYLFSKEGQEVMMKGNLSSPRTDTGSLENKFKKLYVDGKYPIVEYEKKYREWQGLIKNLFIPKR